jgi:hypothetical protein
LSEDESTSGDERDRVRIPFPERISFVKACYCALLFCAIQVYQGTTPLFSLGCLFFILVSVVAFNMGGGFTRPSGGYIFFFATLTAIVGFAWKAVLGEPADSNLQNPLLTISVYCGCIAMMLVAVFFSTKLKTKRALLAKMVTDANMQTATVGCLISGIVLFVIGPLLEGGNGSVISAINQVNRFFPMAIILGVIHAIRRSGGTRSISLPILLAAGFSFSFGLLGFSKEGMLTPFLCWLVAAGSQRYKVSRTQIVGSVLAAIFIFQYLVPYAQFGRAYRPDDNAGSLDTSISLLSNLGYVREQYLENSADTHDESSGYGYYNEPQGFFDRLQMISIDDALIDHTRQFGTFGLFPLVASFENLVPHFIWKDKPSVFFGNVFAHEIGMLSEEDTTTGISFSPVADAFHMEGWMGVFVVAPLMWLLLFTVFDSLCGDVRKSPWGLLAIVTFGHTAPEGGLGVIAYLVCYTVFAIVFAAVMAAYLMPILGTLFIGPEGIQIRRGAPVRSIPSRVAPLPTPES